MQRLVLLFAALLLFSCRTQQHKVGKGMLNMPELNYSGTAALKKALGDRPLILAGEIIKRGGKRVALLEGRHVVGPAPGRATCGTPTTSGIWLLFTGDRAAALQLCGGWYDVGPSATWWVHDPKRKCLAAAVRPRYEKVGSIKLGSGPRALEIHRLLHAAVLPQLSGLHDDAGVPFYYINGVVRYVPQSYVS